MHKETIKDKSFHFAVKIVELYKALTNEQKEWVISKQLLKSGTSIGANIRESQNAESKKDFIHKLAIAQKECDETIYWLDLLYHGQYVTKEQYENIKNEAESMLKMIKSSIITTKNRYLNPNHP